MVLRVRSIIMPTSLLVVIAGIIILRDPLLIQSPRFWAEEGSVYFRAAYDSSWVHALIASHQGYYSLVPNAVTLIAARCVALEWAPLVTTLAALLVQLIPFTVIFIGRCEIWQTWPRKITVAAIILLNPYNGNLFLNTINSQFFLGLTVFLILMEPADDPDRFRKYYFRVLIVIAGLTGPVACMLLPAFFLKYFLHRSRDNRRLVLVTCLAAAVQVGYFLHKALVNQLSFVFNRSTGCSAIHYLAAQFSKNVLALFTGPYVSDFFGKIHQEISRSGDSALITGELVFLVVQFILILYPISHREYRTRYMALIAVCFLFLSIGTFVLTVDQKDTLALFGRGQRYFYVPAIMVMLLIVHVSQQAIRFRNRGMQIICTGLIILYLGSGLSIFRYHFHSSNGPVWQEEVNIWRRTPDYALSIHPPGWSMELKSHASDSWKSINAINRKKRPGKPFLARNLVQKVTSRDDQAEPR